MGCCSSSAGNSVDIHSRAVRFTIMKGGTQAIPHNEDHFLQQQMHSWTMQRSCTVGSKEVHNEWHGHIKSAIQYSNDVFIFRSVYESMSALRDADRFEKPLLRKIMKNRKIYSSRELIGQVVMRTPGDAQQCDGPLPGLIVEVPLKHGRELRFVELAHSRAFEGALMAEPHKSMLQVSEVVLATEIDTGVFRDHSVAIVRFVWNPEEEFHLDDHPLTWLLHAAASCLRAPPQYTYGLVTWTYDEPPSPKLSPRVRKLLLKKLPSHGRRMRTQAIGKTKEHKSMVRDAILQYKERRSNSHLERGSHGHDGEPRLRHEPSGEMPASDGVRVSTPLKEKRPKRVVKSLRVDSSRAAISAAEECLIGI